MTDRSDTDGPLIFEYPPYMDADTAAWILNNHRERGLITPRICDQIDKHGVMYIPKTDTGDQP